MPEGDSIFKVARELRRVLAGARVVYCDSPHLSIAHAGLAGHAVAAVESRGKNLLIHFDDGRVLHTHLRMKGRWRITRSDAPPLRRTDGLRLVLETATHRAACFDAPVVRLLTARAVARDRPLANLGPDLVKDDFDAALAQRRLRAEGERTIAEALMLQRALAGIGNVYKSETLFVRRVNPFAKVAALDDATLDGLVSEARRLLRRNLDRGPRVTRSAIAGTRHWVYDRAGEPCLVCGTRIERTTQAQRSTYYCPTCQGARDD